MRTVVLVDSDRCFPEQVTKNIERVNQWCSEYASEGWVLNKREAENYIPIKALNNATSKKRIVPVFRAFCRLNQTQRDYFDMKNGFPSTGVPPEQSNLYSGINPADITKLQSGFGADCWRIFNRHELFTAEEIRRMCPDDPEEIPRILDSLESLI